MSEKRDESDQRPGIERIPAIPATVPTGWPGSEDRSLEAEIAYYLSHLPEWHEHQGEHILIRGAEQYGFYPTRNEALAEGFRRFGRVSFLVKQVDLHEKPRPMVWVIL